MDGNGRWAAQRGLPRRDGHAAGATALRALAESCARRGLKHLTVFAFSEENWNRTQAETAFLMDLLRRFLIAECPTVMAHGIRLQAIGRLNKLPPHVRAELDRVCELSRGNPGMVLSLALSYGGQQELVDAMRSIALGVARGAIDPGAINEALVTSFLYQPSMPPADLLVRTGGEMRLSNFILWHLAYAEVYVTRVCWPDFGEVELELALTAFRERTRTFGRIPQAEAAAPRQQ